MLSHLCFSIELFATLNTLEFLSGKEIEFHLIPLNCTIILTTRSSLLVKFDMRRNQQIIVCTSIHLVLVVVVAGFVENLLRIDPIKAF